MKSVREPASISLGPGERLLLHDVSWEEYEELLDELAEHRWRLAYDGGKLEIMSPSQKHENVKHYIGRFVEAMAEELDIEIQCYGSATYRRKAKRKGIEADECYYVANEPLVRGKAELEFPKIPPPDLGIEVDIYSSSLNKFKIYAAIGVPELWCYSNEKIEVHLLEPDGRYRPSERSALFPFLPMKELERFLKLRHSMGRNALMKSFRQWARTLSKKNRQV
ncbi:MAG: Uma2 family endonuclease [Planctomycetes bacterium]|nr:Uma2 family endonuclease [Planctomycetota bacterium]